MNWKRKVLTKLGKETLKISFWGIPAAVREESRWLSCPRRASPWLSDPLTWSAPSCSELLVHCAWTINQSFPRCCWESEHFHSKPSGEEAVVHLPMVLCWTYHRESPQATRSCSHGTGVCPTAGPCWAEPQPQHTSPLPAAARFQGAKHKCSATASALQIGAGSPRC